MDIINEDKDEDEKRYKINDIQDIRLNNYQGRYGDKPVNKKLDFDISKSDKVLIQGQNGAGKSTLIDSIIGFNRTYLGDILYNNKDLRLIDLASLWERISYVSQKTLVFEQSIRNNIILDKDFDNDKYTKIIKSLGLDRLDDGLIVNEKQNNLSGGEIQKILIGRAIYKESDLVIMDEPFSALDSASIKRLVSRVRDDDRTYIIIAHNLSKEIRESFDEVIEIEKL
ncbi:ABC transporter ATP-binding protein [Anaerococcus sp. AGMB09787]|uniref:ATP-binding cassette domain-containing protein n=1 Tax=Anaerococcus sp. AGMB09787 TaxID=2922869 RepID=UPI001FAE9DF0|nr:ABC transporter ATP-binding protein [Anaerococcus sp. AGMB09787]